MTAVLLCSVLLVVTQLQAPGTGASQAPRRDTAARSAPIRHTAPQAVAQPPTIIVEAPSQWPVVVIGVATLLLLAVQLRIMARQTDILDRQTTLAAQQAEWRVDEAVGTFVRLAFDLVAEFRKANVWPLTEIPADFNTHPRHMLREASRLFAPLGAAFLFAVNQAAMRLDDYFSAVEAYNRVHRSREGADRLQTVQSLRAQVGGDLDLANRAIPKRSRWVYADGSDYDFRKLCSPPPGFLLGPDAAQC